MDPARPSLMSQVKHNGRDNTSPRDRREVGHRIYRAEERAGHWRRRPALMRGLETEFPFVRLGLSRSEVGRRSDDWPHSFLEDSPAVIPPLLLLRLIPLDADWNGGALGRSSAPYDSGGPQPRTTLGLPSFPCPRD